MLSDILVTKKMLEFEKKLNIWEYSLLGYPIYANFRVSLLDGGAKVQGKVKFNVLFKLINDLKTIFKLIKNKDKIQNIVFISPRSINVSLITSICERKITLFVIKGDFTHEDKLENQEIISDAIIIIMRILLIVTAFAISPLIILIHIKFIFAFLKLSNLIKRKVGLRKIYLNYILFVANIIFCEILLRLNFVYYISGGSCPNIITYTKLNGRVFEVQHGFIGNGHQLYSDILREQCPLVTYWKNTINIQNRKLIYCEAQNSENNIYYTSEGEIVYYESIGGYFDECISKELRNKVNYIPHPANSSKNIKKKVIAIKYAFAEPSTIVLEIIKRRIPLSIVCEMKDINAVCQYFGIDKSNYNFLSPLQVNKKIKDLLNE